MTYAIIRLGGKQFMVEKGDKIELERQQSPLNLDVLYYSNGKEIMIGDPVLPKVQVKAKILEEKQGDKIRVARFKSKSRYRRVKGHRQPLSIIEIQDITVGAASAKKEESVVKEAKKKTEPKSVAKAQVKKTAAKKTPKKVAKKEESSKK